MDRMYPIFIIATLFLFLTTAANGTFDFDEEVQRKLVDNSKLPRRPRNGGFLRIQDLVSGFPEDKNGLDKYVEGTTAHHPDELEEEGPVRVAHSNGAERVGQKTLKTFIPTVELMPYLSLEEEEKSLKKDIQELSTKTALLREEMSSSKRDMADDGDYDIPGVRAGDSDGSDSDESNEVEEQPEAQVEGREMTKTDAETQLESAGVRRREKELELQQRLTPNQDEGEEGKLQERASVKEKEVEDDAANERQEMEEEAREIEENARDQGEGEAKHDCATKAALSNKAKHLQQHILKEEIQEEQAEQQLEEEKHQLERSAEEQRLQNEQHSIEAAQAAMKANQQVQQVEQQAADKMEEAAEKVLQRSEIDAACKMEEAAKKHEEEVEEAHAHDGGNCPLKIGPLPKVTSEPAIKLPPVPKDVDDSNTNDSAPHRQYKIVAVKHLDKKEASHVKHEKVQSEPEKPVHDDHVKHEKAQSEPEKPVHEDEEEPQNKNEKAPVEEPDAKPAEEPEKEPEEEPEEVPNELPTPREEHTPVHEDVEEEPEGPSTEEKLPEAEEPESEESTHEEKHEKESSTFTWVYLFVIFPLCVTAVLLSLVFFVE